jgi:hypothetical protein
VQHLYVLTHHADGTSMVLNLDPKTGLDAQRAINWQRQGGFTEPMSICRFDAAATARLGRLAFTEVNNAGTLTPDQAPFTREAWETFAAKLTGNRESAQ